MENILGNSLKLLENDLSHSVGNNFNSIKINKDNKLITIKNNNGNNYSSVKGRFQPIFFHKITFGIYLKVVNYKLVFIVFKNIF